MKEKRNLSSLLKQIYLSVNNEELLKKTISNFSHEECDKLITNALAYSFASNRETVNKLIDENRLNPHGIKQKNLVFDQYAIMGYAQKNYPDRIEITSKRQTTFRICDSKELDPKRLSNDGNLFFAKHNELDSSRQIYRMEKGRYVLTGTPNKGKYLWDKNGVYFSGFTPRFFPLKTSQEEVQHLSDEEVMNYLAEDVKPSSFSLDPLLTHETYYINKDLIPFDSFINALGNAFAHKKFMDKGNTLIIKKHFNEGRSSKWLAIDKHWLKAVYETIAIYEEDLLQSNEDNHISSNYNLYALAIIATMKSFSTEEQFKTQAFINELQEDLKSYIAKSVLKAQSLYGKGSPRLIKKLVEDWTEKINSAQEKYDETKVIFSDNMLIRKLESNGSLTKEDQLAATFALQSAYHVINYLYENLVLPYREKTLTAAQQETLEKISKLNVLNKAFYLTSKDSDGNLCQKFVCSSSQTVELISLIRNSLSHGQVSVIHNRESLDPILKFKADRSIKEYSNEIFCTVSGILDACEELPNCLKNSKSANKRIASYLINPITGKIYDGQKHRESFQPSDYYKTPASPNGFVRIKDEREKE